MLKKYLRFLILLLLVPVFVYAEEETITDTMYNSDTPIVEEDTDKVKYINDETNYKLVIDDEADLLTELEERELEKLMESLTVYGHIAFVSINDNYRSTESFADDYYHKEFGTSSGTLFLIDMDNRKIYIFSDGKNYAFITNSKAYTITDNVYRFATNQEYFECAKEAYKEIETILEGGKINEPMRNITNGLITIIIVFFGNFIFMINKSKLDKAPNKEILKYANASFDMGEITSTLVGVSKVYNPPSDSDSGGSSGGGGGGGGGSSGGGGGHSF